MKDKELHDLVQPELEALGFELIKAEVVGSSKSPVVRIYIDKPEGVTLDDCSRASRTLSLVLEREDPFAGKYLLEVSSPGRNRPLTAGHHFERFVGSAAKVRARVGEERTTLSGEIRGHEEGVVTLTTDDGDVAIHLRDIIDASLIEPEYKIDKKKAPRERRQRSKKH